MFISLDMDLNESRDKFVNETMQNKERSYEILIRYLMKRWYWNNIRLPNEISVVKQGKCNRTAAMGKLQKDQCSKGTELFTHFINNMPERRHEDSYRAVLFIMSEEYMPD